MFSLKDIGVPLPIGFGDGGYPHTVNRVSLSHFLPQTHTYSANSLTALPFAGQKLMGTPGVPFGPGTYSL